MRFIADHEAQIGKRVCERSASRAFDEHAAGELLVGRAVGHEHFRYGCKVVREAFQPLDGASVLVHSCVRAPLRSHGPDAAEHRLGEVRRS